MDFTFVERRPTGRLGRYVASVWHASGQIPYRRERTTPTGSTVPGLVLGPPILQTPAAGLLSGPPSLTAPAGGAQFCADFFILIGPHDLPLTSYPARWTLGVR